MPDRLVCHYCIEDATYDGPRGRGNRNVALLQAAGLTFVFCSPACRSRWVDVVGSAAYDTRDMAVADDVPPEALR